LASALVEKNRIQERDDLLNKAQAKGKFACSPRPRPTSTARCYDADPERTRKIIDRMPENLRTGYRDRLRRRSGCLVSARRGETVDIPEGEDLARGDKFGAFMPEVGQEPPSPLDTKLIQPQPQPQPQPQLDWTPTEWDRYVDAAHISEVQEQLAARAEIDRAPLALLIIEAENRKGNPRSKLIEYLNGIAGITTYGLPVGPDTTGLTGAPEATPTPSVPVPGPENSTPPSAGEPEGALLATVRELHHLSCCCLLVFVTRECLSRDAE
jgi:hypothetical protein